MILAIDPGPEQSAYVLYDNGTAVSHGKSPNGVLLDYVRLIQFNGGPFRYADVVVIEMVASFGMPVGREVFETVFWIGVFAEACGISFERVTRGAVKLHLCHSMRAKDSNVRQALLDRFGGKEKAMGNKRSPGPLYGVSGDVWSALAVAVTYADMQSKARAA